MVCDEGDLVADERRLRGFRLATCRRCARFLCCDTVRDDFGCDRCNTTVANSSGDTLPASLGQSACVDSIAMAMQRSRSRTRTLTGFAVVK